MQLSPVVVGVLALLVAGTSAMHAKEEAGNPLGKVLELLTSLAAKITEEGETHDKAYKDYYEWCEDFTRQKLNEIKTLTAQKAKSEATIAKASADIDSGAAAIEELAAAVATADKELSDATLIRKKEHTDFEKTEAELLDAVDMLGRAVSVLTREMQGGAALAQVSTDRMESLVQSVGAVIDAAGFSSHDRTKLLALVQSQQSASEDDDSELGAPAPAAYENKSGSIVDVLEDMKEKAEAELSEARKAEAIAKHNFDMLAQSLKDKNAADAKDMEEEKTNKAEAEEAKAVAEGELEMTTKALAEAEKALKEEREGCMSVAKDHDITLRGRAEELEAIATAKKILQESTGGAVAQTYSFLQLSSRVTVQSKLRSHAKLAGGEVLSLVKKLADSHHSRALAQLASRIGAVLKFGATGGEDPFKKVKGLIASMMEKLMKEAAEEAEEKAYCDEEMEKTEAKKGELEDGIDGLTAKIDKAAAASARLKEEVKALEEELAALHKLQAEMDKARAEENAHYKQASAELQAGLEGVRKALSVLQDYYASKEEDAASLLQGETTMSAMMQQPAVPVNHAPATGAGGGIISILEVVESDFAKNMAQEEAEESDSQEAYDKTTQENKVVVAEKQQDAKYKTQEFKALDQSIAEQSADRDTAQTELSAVDEYYAKLKERCVAKPESYEERKQRREAEISGLKSALSILEGEAAFVQQSHRGLRGIRLSGLQ